MKDALDFAAINQAALAAFPAVLSRLLPRGKAVGREIVALNPRRPIASLGIVQGQSIQRPLVRLRHRRQGRRSGYRLSPISRMFRRARRRACSPKCSASKPGGGAMDNRLRSLRALDRSRACGRGAAKSAATSKPDAPKPTCPPVDAENGALAAARLYGRKPDGSWRYETAQGETAFYAARWNEGGRQKDLSPALVVRGRRLAIRRLGQTTARSTTCPPSLRATERADHHLRGRERRRTRRRRSFPIASPRRPAAALARRPRPIGRLCAGRPILIWPDHDAAGEKYAREVATILATLDCSVSIIDAKALAAIDPGGGAREPIEKWDAADAMAEWRDLAALAQGGDGTAQAFRSRPGLCVLRPL